MQNYQEVVRTKCLVDVFSSGSSVWAMNSYNENNIAKSVATSAESDIMKFFMVGNECRL